MKRDRPSARGQTALLLVGQIGAWLVFFPRPSIEAAGRLAPFALLLGAVFALLSVRLTLWAAGRLAGEAGKKAPLHRPGGKAASLLLGAYGIFAAGLAIRAYVQIVKTLWYPAVPLWSLVLALLLSVLLSRAATATVIARAAQVMLLVALPIFIVTNLLLIPNLEFAYLLLPGPPIPPRALGSGSFGALYIFLSADTLFALAPRLGGQAYTDWRPAGAAIGLEVLLALIGYVSALGLFGLDHIRMILWPLTMAFRELAFPGFLVNRLGLVVVLSWTFLVFVSVRFRMWAANATLQAAWGFPERWGRPAVLALVGLVALFPWTPSVVQATVSAVLVPGAWLVGFGVPLALGLLTAGGARRRASLKPS